MALWREIKQHTHENSNRIQLLTDKNGLKWGRTFLNKQLILSDNRCPNRATIHWYVNRSSLIRTLNSIWSIAWEIKIIFKMGKRKISKRIWLQAPLELYLPLKSHIREKNPGMPGVSSIRKECVFLSLLFFCMCVFKFMSSILWTEKTKIHFNDHFLRDVRFYTWKITQRERRVQNILRQAIYMCHLLFNPTSPLVSCPFPQDKGASGLFWVSRSAEPSFV